MQKHKLHIALLLVFFQTIYPAFSQKETNNWFFGYNAGLNFNSGSPIPISGGKLQSWECSSSVSDNAGNLLFYTDWDTVWDKNNNQMPNGVLGNSNSTFTSTQGSLIVKKPLSPNLYYIFNIGGECGNGLVNSVVDMNANTGLGDVVDKQISTFSIGGMEKLTAIKHCNNRDIWIITLLKDTVIKASIMEGSSDIFSIKLCSFLLTPYGISNYPVITDLGDMKSATCQGQLKSNPQGTHLAFGSEYGYSILKFDKETGRIINLISSTYSRLNGYGLEFSPDGKLLYFNKTQIELETGNKIELGYPTLSQFQLALNNKIYFVNYDSSEFIYPPGYDTAQFNYPPTLTVKSGYNKKLSVINNPNTIGLGCNIDYDTISLGNDSMFIGLPNFPAYYFYHPLGEFTYQNDCAGDSTAFNLVNNPVLDSVKWLFGDNYAVSTELSPKHLFAEAGSYDISVIIYNNGIADTTTQCVSINGIYSNAFEMTDTTICKGKPIKIGVTYPYIGNYLWNTGDTTAGITTNTSGSYWLTITNDCGSYTSNINVNEIDCFSQTIDVPNVFTPNGDNNNDIFGVNIQNIKKLNFTIYNRWGVKMNDGLIMNLSSSYQSISLWNGRTKAGLECPDGVYYYFIEYENSDSSLLNKKGFLELIR